MKTGQAGLELIKQFEGCRLEAYKCPAGVWTIGYGHTGKVDGKAVCSGMKITNAKAESLLKADLATFEKSVNGYVTVPINQNQFDALVSFTYNLGAGNLKSSTLLKKLNAKDYKGAANEFPKWNKAGGKVLEGLTRRREAEKKLFLTPVDGNTKPSKPDTKPTPKPITLTVTANNGLHCRSGMSTNSTIIGSFAKGTKVTLISKSSKDWYKVKGKCIAGKMIEGYCSSQYLK